MSPTNDDHILECTLLFDRTVPDGRVALLTRDTALKIKGMAEVVFLSLTFHSDSTETHNLNTISLKTNIKATFSCYLQARRSL